jgi:hypothetical protein
VKLEEIDLVNNLVSSFLSYGKAYPLIANRSWLLLELYLEMVKLAELEGI